MDGVGALDVAIEVHAAMTETAASDAATSGPRFGLWGLGGIGGILGWGRKKRSQVTGLRSLDRPETREPSSDRGEHLLHAIDLGRLVGVDVL
jgi:MYXO-CTERM domain-containing protein